MTTLMKSNTDKLQDKIKGAVLVPGDPAFEEARRVWNAMIDRRPAVIVRCADAADVAPAIAFARENGLEISVRGGGHHIAGLSVCDGGLMIDFSAMKKIDVDAGKRRAYVEPGATLADFDRAVQEHGLATPVGINSTTGIAGLTLGGGFGWLTREYGMTIDNLTGADMVLADGKKLHVSATENTDLFWAIRGGGGNFGVVTRFEFNLRPVGPTVFAGLLVFPFKQARQVLGKYREFVRSAPLNLNVWAILRQAPPLPFLPAAVHGQEVVVLAVFYNGDVAEGERLIQPLRQFGDLLGEHAGPMPYTQWQQAFDPLLTPGARNYWKSHNFTELSDGVVDALIAYAGKLPSPECELFVGLLAGAANDVPSDATAYSARDARFVINVHGRWREAEQDEKCIAWSRAFFQAAARYASSGAYVNFMTADESDRVAGAYGANYARLLEIKQRYDPENVFHLNQNIPAKQQAGGMAQRSA
ncbi:MAG: FAD-binding oxidoreductase [Actinomycetota bacterium]